MNSSDGLIYSDKESGLFSLSDSSSDISTLASEVNISDTVSASFIPKIDVVVQQVMMSDAAHNINYVILPETKQDPLHFHISISLHRRKRSSKTSAMVDSGATAMFISNHFVAKNAMLCKLLERKIVLYNINGTQNKAGTISHKVVLYLKVGNQERKWDFLITDLGPEDVILGLPWLRHVNPHIDWSNGEIKLPSENILANTEEEEAPASVFRINANRMQRRKLMSEKVIDRATDEIWYCAGFTYSQAIAEKEAKKKADKSFEELVPKKFWNRRHLFSNEATTRLPKHQPWDHKIDFTPDAKPT